AGGWRDLRGGGAREGRGAEPMSEGLGQELRAADEVAGRSRLVITPHEREQGRAEPGGDLAGLRGDTLGDGPEDRRDVRMEVAKVGGEGLVVSVGEHPRPGLLRRLPGTGACQANVLPGGRAKPET